MFSFFDLLEDVCFVGRDPWYCDTVQNQYRSIRPPIHAIMALTFPLRRSLVILFVCGVYVCLHLRITAAKYLVNPCVVGIISCCSCASVLGRTKVEAELKRVTDVTITKICSVLWSIQMVRYTRAQPEGSVHVNVSRIRSVESSLCTEDMGIVAMFMASRNEFERYKEEVSREHI